eukprot:gene9665-1878_t
MAEKKEFKWQVRPGGTIPSDSLGVKHATGQSGSTSLKQSLSINKGIEDSPTIDASAQSIAHATHVPDATFNKREFAKSEGRPIIDGNSAAVAAALKAPKPPRTINSVDKTKQHGLNELCLRVMFARVPSVSLGRHRLNSLDQQQISFVLNVAV